MIKKNVDKCQRFLKLDDTVIYIIRKFNVNYGN